MSDRVRVGIVGTSGYPEFIYLPVLSQHQNVEVVAICGRNETRAAEVAAKYGVPHVFTDYRRMIEQAALDAIVIATPDDLHYPMAMDALSAGLHVLGEKPMALNAQQAKEMLEAAERAAVKHMIMFSWRFFPHYGYMQKLIADGFVGQAYNFHIRFLRLTPTWFAVFLHPQAFIHTRWQPLGEPISSLQPLIRFSQSVSQSVLLGGSD
jgi:predicted dehydrogenase